MKNAPSFMDDFSITNSVQKSVDETWNPVLGKKKQIKKYSKYLIFTL